MIKEIKLWHPEVEEFAQAILGLPDDFEGDVAQELEDHFECSFDTFQKIIGTVIQYTPTHVSPLTKRLHRGFIKDGSFLLKYELQEPKP